MCFERAIAAALSSDTISRPEQSIAIPRREGPGIVEFILRPTISASPDRIGAPSGRR
jgi:hypothetical protein